MIKWVWRRVRVRKTRKKASAVGKRDYEMMKESARVLVHSRLEFFNTHYKFTYKKVFIKNTTTRWGGCSSHGNLNFNYKIVKLAPELADYLIVHEMCHLREMNHGPRFWALISETIPNYEVLNRQLKKIPLSS
jgi:predicted metal-dependent hydrolase